MDIKSWEEQIVRNAAPTLAGIKVASLFSCEVKACTEPARCRELQNMVATYNELLAAKGVCIRLFPRRHSRCLVYVYRPQMLRELLHKPEVISFLGEHGYEAHADLQALDLLETRLAGTEDFPHEIGVFLGYELEDVRAFIMHRGQNCSYAGLWKVYGKVEEAQELFARITACRKRLCHMFENRKSTLLQLTTAVS